MSMKKVKVKYESHIFQEDNVDKFIDTTIGEVNEEGNQISFLLTQDNVKELVTFIYAEDKVMIQRKNYTLTFIENELVECENNTEYGVITLHTRLKKRLRLENQFVINYELLIGNDSIGSYVIKISYEED